jgi:hypothetical protein
MRTTVSIVLEIEEEREGDALTVIDTFLENGGVQDPLNDHEHEECGPLKVRVAMVVAGAPAGYDNVTVHCTGGCGDVDVPRASLDAGRCPVCGRDLEPLPLQAAGDPAPGAEGSEA